MRFIRSTAVSLATALLLVFMISVFAPAFTYRVNAAGDTIEVSNANELKASLESSDSKGKTIKIKSSSITIQVPENITICTSLTLELNNSYIYFAAGKNMSINTENEDDVVSIHYGGIYANIASNVITVEKGKLITDSVNYQNLNAEGYCFNSSRNIMILSGAFKSKYELGEDINIPYKGVVDRISDDGFNECEIYSVYGLNVCGYKVNPDNCDDILGNGIFSYDPWTTTLYINGDYDYGIEKCIINSYIRGLTICINKPSSITGYIDLYDNTTITGGNKLTLKTHDYFVAFELFDDISLKIKDVSLEIICGTAFAYCPTEIYDSPGNEVIIEDAEILDHSTNEFARELKSVELTDCNIVYPMDAIISEGKVLESDGKTPACSVGIQPVNCYEPAEYTWSDDYSTCSALLTHRFDSKLNKTETVNTTSKVKIEATTTEKGTTTYTAAFKNKLFKTQTKDVQDIPVLQPDPVKDPPTQAPSTSTPTVPDEPTVTGGGFEEFVERLYTVALNRPSEPEGKAFWCEHVGNGDLNGAQCANEFLLSKEFNDRKLSDEDFLKVLYKTFFDRDAAKDPDGFNFWMNSLKTEGRDKVVDGFINSTEWCNICASYGVKSGATRAKATIASENAIAFAKRLYTECLGREAEEGGLKFWSLGLTNLELTGAQAAHEFFFSKEFNEHNFDNKELITRMYKTFMGRDPEDDGMNYWLKEMENGMTKEQVFNEFVKSKEFTEICQKYAIDRG